MGKEVTAAESGHAGPRGGEDLLESGSLFVRLCVSSGYSMEFDNVRVFAAEQWNTASNRRHCNKHFAILVGEHSSLNSCEDTKRVKRGRGAAKGTGRNGKVCTVEKEEWRCGQQATMQRSHSEDGQVHTLVCCSPQPRWDLPLGRSRAGSRPRKRPAGRERAGVSRQTGVRWVI